MFRGDKAMKFTIDNEWHMLGKNFFYITFFSIHLDKDFSYYGITIFGFTLALERK